MKIITLKGLNSEKDTLDSIRARINKRIIDNFDKTNIPEDYVLELIDCNLVAFNNNPDWKVAIIKIINSWIGNLSVYGREIGVEIHASEIRNIIIGYKCYTNMKLFDGTKLSKGSIDVESSSGSVVDFVFVEKSIPLLRLYDYASNFLLSYKGLNAAAHLHYTIFRRKHALIVAGARNARL